MDSQSEHSMSTAWEHAGEHAASALDASNVVAVIGAEPAAAARVALGIGRVQAQRRRVAIADAVGEVQPLRELAPPDASHGLVDYFFYGVSLAKVAHPVNMARNLFVLQSGAPPIDHEALLRDARWSQLSRSFRDANALLLIVPPEHAGVDALVPLLDGVVLVGDALAPLGTRVLSRVQVEPPTAATPLATAPATAPAEAGPSAPLPPRRQRAPRRRAPLWTAVGIAALVLIAVAGWVIWQRQAGTHATAAGSVAGTAAARAPRAPGAPGAPADSLGGSAAGVDVTGSNAAASPFTIANPADSVAAVAYAVAFVETNSPSTANARIEQEIGRGLPALTYAPVPSAAESGRLFVITGALHDRAGADSLLRALRARGVLRARQGHVEHLPLALLVQRGAGHDQASFLVNGYRLKGLPVYALEQPDGTLNLYAGAFDAPEAARALMTSFHAIGEQPRVVYRTGRML